MLLVLGLFTALVMLEPDLDSTIVLAHRRCWRCSSAGGVAEASPGGGVRARDRRGHRRSRSSEPYRRARMLTFLDPFADASNTGYQIAQSLIALGSGGFTGVGLGAGRAKWKFLPNAHTDFIFAIIGEELGLVGCFLVLGLFIAFAVLGVRAALRAPDRFGVLLAAGVTAWVVGQAVINIGAVVGLLPGLGHPAAVRVVRWLGARHHDGRRRHAGEHRPPGPRPAPRPRRAPRTAAARR